MSKLLQLSWKLLHPAESPAEAEVYERVCYLSVCVTHLHTLSKRYSSDVAVIVAFF